jgi:hypothetical protein
MRECIKTETSQRELWGTVVSYDGSEAEIWASRFPTTRLKERMRVKCMVKRTIETTPFRTVSRALSRASVESLDDEPAIAS